MIHDIVRLAARVAVGEGMAAHGAQKAFGWFDGPGPEGAAKIMEGLGFRPAAGYGALASWNEIVSGQLIAAGLGGPIGPAMLLANMIVASSSVHAKNGFFIAKGGVELGVLYSAAALALAPDYGALSLDRALGIHAKLRHPIFTTLTLAGAIASAVLILRGRATAPAPGAATPTYRGKNSPLPSETEPTAASA